MCNKIYINFYFNIKNYYNKNKKKNTNPAQLTFFSFNKQIQTREEDNKHSPCPTLINMHPLAQAALTLKAGTKDKKRERSGQRSFKGETNNLRSPFPQFLVDKKKCYLYSFFRVIIGLYG